MSKTDRTSGVRLAFPALLALALAPVTGAALAHQPPGTTGAPEGITRATIIDEGGISVMSAMVLDAPKPALMIRYHGEEALTVYDGDNKPFLRFTENRVEAHVQSSQWQVLPQSRGYQSKGNTTWVQVSGSGNFGWVDPRLSLAGGGHSDETAGWRIPVTQGDQQASAITGRLTWRPIQVQASQASH